MDAAAPLAAARVTPTLARRGSFALALALMTASGFAGLSYQIVWTRQAALWLGHESAAVLAVLAAFFGGLALGALLFGEAVRRSAHPHRWYAGCEAVIGVWSVVVGFTLQLVAERLVGWIGAEPSPLWHGFVAFFGTLLLLLPATGAMGATLPAMERVLAGVQRDGAAIAGLYASNTFGAVAGVLAAAFVLVPQVGLARTAILCASLNLLCAVAALKLSSEPAGSAAAARGAPARALLWTLAITGLLGIGYEVLVVRILSQVAENTVYTFAIVLAVYLVGTALGAAAFTRWPVASPAGRDRLLQALGVSVVLSAVSLAAARSIKDWVLGAAGPGVASALAAETAIAAAAFLLPTIVMGALFCHLSTRAAAGGTSFARALGINTLGATAAAPLFGVVLVPSVGTKLALAGIAAGYLALASPRAWRAPLQWAAAVAVVALGAWRGSLALVDVPPGGRVVQHEEGVLATVSIVEDAAGVATLHIDNRQQEGSTATRLADARQALLPLLLHPKPERALFLGLGTGATAAWATRDPRLAVDAVELVPEVIAASAYFAQRAGDTGEHRFRAVAADARRFVRAATVRYDVIVADNFHPARSGSGSLYTVEHFTAVRERLAADGVFCQWLPLHQLDLETLASVVRSFLLVYPDTWAMLATNSLDTPVVGLVARRDGGLFHATRLHERRDGAAELDPAALGVADDLALAGTFIAGPRALARFASAAPLNTDDRAVVAYLAPRITYAPDSQPRDRLLALLHKVDIAPDALFAAEKEASADTSARLAAYWAARDRFIEVGRDVRPTADVLEMLAQVREPLLEVLAISPDFRPAYDPLLRMAADLSRVDASAASALLEDLERVQPSRPEASQLLHELPR